MNTTKATLAAMLLGAVLVTGCRTTFVRYEYLPTSQGIDQRTTIALSLSPTWGARDSSKVARNPYSLLVRFRGPADALERYSIVSVSIFSSTDTVIAQTIDAPLNFAPDSATVGYRFVRDLHIPAHVDHSVRVVIRYRMPDGKMREHAVESTFRAVRRVKRTWILGNVFGSV